MKFLVINTPRAGALPLADPVAAYQAAKAYIDGMLASHKADCCYALTNGGGATIANAASAEEMAGSLFAYPMYGQFDWTVQPLADVDVVLSGVIEQWKKMPK